MCEKGSQVADLVKIMLKDHIQRVWMVEERYPRGIVSMTDILGVLCPKLVEE